jgi:hypothetical protein
VYDRAGYEVVINYTQAPTSALAEADMGWIDEFSSPQLETICSKLLS